MRKKGLGGQQDRLDVDGENSVELRLLDLHERLVAMGRSGVLTTMSTRANASIAAFAARSTSPRFDTSAHRDRPATKPLGGRFRDVAFKIETCDARALAHEGLRDAEPEALSRAVTSAALPFNRISNLLVGPRARL